MTKQEVILLNGPALLLYYKNWEHKSKPVAFLYQEGRPTSIINPLVFPDLACRVRPFTEYRFLSFFCKHF